MPAKNVGRFCYLGALIAGMARSYIYTGFQALARERAQQSFYSRSHAPAWECRLRRSCAA